MISSVDTTSPFFTSLAGQSEVQAERQKAERTKQKITEAPKKTFKSVLTDTVETESAILTSLQGKSKEDAIQILMAEIETTGDALAKKPLAENLLPYKQAVTAFIHFVVKNSYTTVTTQSGLLHKKKQQTVIRIIDETLNRLAADIMLNQQSRLKILERLGEIHGLLIDITS